jgi:hypothetical protein
MLQENTPVAIMTLAQYYKKLLRMQGIKDESEDDIFRPANTEKRLKIVQMVKSRPEVEAVVKRVMKDSKGLKLDK